MVKIITACLDSSMILAKMLKNEIHQSRSENSVKHAKDVRIDLYVSSTVRKETKNRVREIDNTIKQVWLDLDKEFSDHIGKK